MARKIRDTEANETTDTKAKRIAIGATIAGVLLMVFLVIILVIQFAKIGVRNAERNRLQTEVDKYEQLNSETEKDLGFFQTEEGLRMLAVMNGYKDKKK